jgi:2-(1,2-epoxy-1,2-dihydrophenyl)acetyl-CoA isomerase
MADFEFVVDGTIGWMRFNRPEKLNAITYEMLALIDESIAAANADSRVRVVVLTGTGRAFSAGTDLQELSSRPRGAERGDARERYADRPTVSRPAPWTFASIAKPTIAAVNGVAVGLGAEFTLQCDFRIAGESARWGWVFVHRGLVPDTGAGTWLLPRVVGLQRAAEILYSGEMIDARRAVEVGLALEVVPDGELEQRAAALAHRVSRGSPLATGETKRMLYRGLARGPEEHLPDTRETLDRMFASNDFKEGVRAFLERREPDWTGT